MGEEEEHRSLPNGALVGGRFKVERLIGRGGMGEVYAARHATTGKEVALKLIHAQAGAGKDHVRRFMREARAATAIQHPNVIEVFDVFEDADGTPVMVMELLKGEPFSAYRERAGALKLHEAAAVLLPAARALQVAHEKGIVHRDLKPDNVFLADLPTGRTTKVLDFGIAKVLDPARLGSETQGQNTNTGSILGTPHYMSYEQAMSDKQVDHRTDVWAMGVMLFEALTGRRPMTYDTLGQMYASLLQGTVPSIREFVPELPEDAAAVLDHCLAKRPEDRLGNLGPLVDVLGKYLDPAVPGADAGGRVVPHPVRPATPVTTEATFSSTIRAKRPTRAATLGMVAVVLAGAGIGGGVYLFSRKTIPAQTGTGGVPSTSAPAPGASPGAENVRADVSTKVDERPPPVPSATASERAPPLRNSSAGGARPPSLAPPPSPPGAAGTASAQPTTAPTKRGIPEQLPY